VAPAKVLTEFAKENQKLEIKAGVMGNKLLDAAAIKSLASLPSREVLLGQVLSTMNGVPTAFVRVLNGVIGNFLNVLTAIRDQKEAG
jgi:large subunit ribosomal protein L10